MSGILNEAAVGVLVKFVVTELKLREVVLDKSIQSLTLDS